MRNRDTMKQYDGWDVSSCETRETPNEKLIAKLESEVKMLTNAGVIECMVRNKSVSEYIGQLESKLSTVTQERDELMSGYKERGKWIGILKGQTAAKEAELVDALNDRDSLAKANAELQSRNDTLSTELVKAWAERDALSEDLLAATKANAELYKLAEKAKGIISNAEEDYSLDNRGEMDNCREWLSDYSAKP